MSKARRLASVGALAALCSVVGLSCGSDLVDLLPMPGGAGSGGNDSAAGRDSMLPDRAGMGGMSGGSSAASQSGSAGRTSGGGGNGGNGGGGGNGGNGGCFGFGCGTAGEPNGFGGSFGCSGGSCTLCSSDQPCKQGYSCDVTVGRCAPSCTTSLECANGRVCDVSQSACVACLGNPDCEQYPDTHVCYLHRCVECLQHADCMQADRHVCAGGYCVQCLSDKDCDGPNGSGGGRCDSQRGRCVPP